MTETFRRALAAHILNAEPLEGSLTPPPTRRLPTFYLNVILLAAVIVGIILAIHL